MMISWRLVSVLALLLPVIPQAAQEEEAGVVAWRELEVTPPPMPDSAQLLPFFVSAASDNRYFVDGASLTVEKDGVVRYVLLVETVGGARNVSFEGIRCETRERRIYATGRRDGSWSVARKSAWERIRDQVLNRHHAALHLEYFCPGGVIVRDAEEAKSALRRGVHPQNVMH